MHRLITLRTALEDKHWLGGMLGADSFSVMRTLLIAAMGEPLTVEELSVFTALTGRLESPTEAAEEVWIIAGRRRVAKREL